MRDIRFRVWDRDKKLIGYNRFDQGRWSCQMLNGGSGEWSNGVLHGAHMDQYTGLKAKGVEIYEADVVRSEKWNPTTYKVGFDRGGFCFFNDGDEFYNDAKDLESFGFEVIGNIYENPELLSPEGSK
jgi:uncharacterized phage protein (TIGR01671 family)